jgi:hypothetical protein
VVAVIAVFFFNQSRLSFDNGAEKINSFWEKQGIILADLTVPAKLNFIEEAKLTALKADLDSFRASLEKETDSEDKEKLELLAETEINLVSNALLQKKTFALIDFFEGTDYDFDVLCSSMSKAEQLHSGLIEQKTSAESFNGKVTSFASSFPAEAKKAGIDSLELQATSDESLTQFNSLVVSLKGVC